jgi:hypothetical protein
MKDSDKTAMGKHGYGAKAMPSPNMGSGTGLKTDNKERADVKATPTHKNPYPSGLS